MSDKRQHIRTKLQVSIKVMHPRLGDVVLQTGDISDSGAYFLTDQFEEFEIGEEFSAQVLSLGDGDAPVVKMRVMRADDRGVGLLFI